MAQNDGYAALTEDEPVHSTAGHTSEQAAAAMEKWGKNEIPEEKEPVNAASRHLPRATGRRLSPRAVADARATTRVAA